MIRDREQVLRQFFSMAPKDPYQVLGLTPQASQDDIKRAYRKLAKQFHPDLNPGNKKAEARFKEINEANELIGDPEKRAQFDRGEMSEPPPGAAQGEPFYYETQGGPESRYARFFRGGGGGGGFSEEDLFSSLFGEGRRAGPARGQDLNFRMEVDFKDAILGARREVTLPGGRKLEVRIPAGIESGTRLRLAGLGEAGSKGQPAGDAYVEVEVRPSPQFRREAYDLVLELSVPFPLAVAGGKSRAPTIEGAVLLSIPPHSRAGTKLRLRGKGVLNEKTGQRGDQIVVLRLDLPDQVDPALESAARAWVERHSGDKEGAQSP